MLAGGKKRAESEATVLHYNSTAPIKGKSEIFLGAARGGSEKKALRGLSQKLELELIQTQMAQKPMLRAEVGMRVRCANKASAE